MVATPDDRSEAEQQLAELTAQVAANRADIDALQAHADMANDTSREMNATAEDQGRRIDRLEALDDVDRQLLAELLLDGMLVRDHADHMAKALASSRVIGAAMGIVMSVRKVGQEDAFEVLKRASQQTNRKLRVIAEEIVETGDVSGLPN